MFINILSLSVSVPGTCTCGRFGFRSDEEDSDRIVGGTVAAANSIPYQVKKCIQFFCPKHK
jgi:hypothetical protein